MTRGLVSSARGMLCRMTALICVIETARDGVQAAVAAVALFALALMPEAPAFAQQQQRPPENAPAAGVLRSINVGFVRHAVGGWTAKIANGGFDTSTGRTIRWYPHDTDSSVVAALSSGRLDIGLMGSPVAASAIARGLDLRIFFVLGASAESDGLVIGVDAHAAATTAATVKIGEPKSLQGKVIAVSFGSSPHFRLLESLKRWGTSVASMRIVNLQSTQIAEAWKRGEIDAAAVSEPLLGQLLLRGRLAVLPGSVDKTGLMVFAAAGDFVAQHLVFLSRFVDFVARADQGSAGSEPLAGDNPDIKSIAFMTGLSPEAVVAAMARNHPPSLEEQATTSWLGGGSESAMIAHLKSAIDVWRWAGRLTGSDLDLATAIAAEPVQMALGYRK